MSQPAPRPDWLGLEGKTVLVTGLKNKKSVAWQVVRQLEEAGARPALVVRTEERRDELAKLIGDRPTFVCDVREQASIDALAAEVAERLPKLKADELNQLNVQVPAGKVKRLADKKGIF